MSLRESPSSSPPRPSPRCPPQQPPIRPPGASAVTFRPTMTIRLVLSHREMSPSEIASYWHSVEEMSDMRADCVKVIAMLRTRKQTQQRRERLRRSRFYDHREDQEEEADTDDDSLSFCSRGLEHIIDRSAFKARDAARKDVIRAVLDCQDKFAHRSQSLGEGGSDVTDDEVCRERIAFASRIVTSASMKAAVEMGLKDSEYVREAYRSDEMKKKQQWQHESEEIDIPHKVATFDDEESLPSLAGSASTVGSSSSVHSLQSYSSTMNNRKRLLSHNHHHNQLPPPPLLKVLSSVSSASSSSQYSRRKRPQRRSSLGSGRRPRRNSLQGLKIREEPSSFSQQNEEWELDQEDAAQRWQRMTAVGGGQQLFQPSSAQTSSVEPPTQVMERVRTILDGTDTAAVGGGVGGMSPAVFARAPVSMIVGASPMSSSSTLTLRRSVDSMPDMRSLLIKNP